MELAIREATLKFMHCSWRSGDSNISVSIDDRELKISTSDDQGMAYSSDGDWWGSYFVFKDLPRFFVLYADEKEMKFGELHLPNDVNGTHKWAARFYRTS